MKARTFANEADARVVIALINAARGFPRTEQGVRVGGGRHVESFTTTTDIEPIELRNGTWAVRSDRIALADISTSGEREIKDDIDDPPDIRVRIQR